MSSDLFHRATSGIRQKTLIINFPGSPKAAKECFLTVAKVIPHAVDLILDARQKIKSIHNSLQEEEPINACKHKKSVKSLGLDNIAGRLRESPFPMVSFEEALNILKNTANPEVLTEEVNIWKAHGKIVAQTVYSQCHLPPFRASIKDGYAVLAEDGPGRRKVLGGIEAGHIVWIRH